MGVGLVAGMVPALLLGGLRYAALGMATVALGGAAGLRLALVRRRGWGARELGFVTGLRSAWHLTWEVPLLLVGGAGLRGDARCPARGVPSREL